MRYSAVAQYICNILKTASDRHAITQVFSVIRVTSRFLSSRLRATQTSWNKLVDFQQRDTNIFTRFSLKNLNVFVTMYRLCDNIKYDMEQTTGQWCEGIKPSPPLLMKNFNPISDTKGSFVSLTALLPWGILCCYPNEFIHSSPEALHTPNGVRDLC